MARCIVAYALADEVQVRIKDDAEAGCSITMTREEAKRHILDVIDAIADASATEERHGG